jgi:hypothetical protein
MTPDHRELRRDVACERGIVALNACASVSPEGASWAAYDWLQSNAAGLPVLPLIEEAMRSEAVMWAETATPIELECYTVAAMDRLQGAPFASRQIKRLVASLWRRMSPEEKTEFQEWASKQ